MDNMCAQCTLSNGLHSHLCVPRQGATAMSEDCHSSDNAVPTTEVQIKLKDALNRMMFVRKCADLLLEKWAAQPYGVPTTEQRLEATMLINLSEEICTRGLLATGIFIFAGPRVWHCCGRNRK